MNKYIKELMAFIDNSPSVYHVIKSIEEMLVGYERLSEEEDWQLKKGGKYYVVRKDSSIIAFRIPSKDYESVYITAAHSDSPSFKVKTNAAMVSEGHYTRLNTEKYGGMNMSSWLDRPLSVAGRVAVNNKGTIETKLFNVDRDLLLIPSVAIHMNRDLNNGMKYDAQVDTIPLFGDEKARESLMENVSKAAGVSVKEILDADIFLYNREKCSVWGANEEFISGRCLDDLECAYGIVKGFLGAKKSVDKLAVCCVFDNEEVGSLTSQGADSTFLSDVLERINESLGHGMTKLKKGIASGYMISADNAHAVHPNHPEYADPTNRPYINGGIVIKYNAAQKYTTDAVSGAMLRSKCEAAGVPVQTYTNKSNVAGGSTLGNLANRHVSIRTVDIGLPQLSMHSSYETAGVKDVEYLIKTITQYYV